LEHAARINAAIASDATVEMDLNGIAGAGEVIEMGGSERVAKNGHVNANDQLVSNL
jgi:hypothetical protein